VRRLPMMMFGLAVAVLLLSAWACRNAQSAKDNSADETPSGAASDGEGFPEEDWQNLLELDPSNFDNSTVIDNEWWPLTPGTRLVYEGVSVENGEKVPHSVEETVTDLTKVINGGRPPVRLQKEHR